MKLLALCAAAAFVGFGGLALSACSPKTETAQATSAPASVDRMPREEVEAIVKDYLLKNPEVLVEAFEELDNRHNQANFAKLVSHDQDPSIGPKDAAVTIVEFFDYNCGYCKAANDWVMKEAAERSGDVRVIFKEFPILRESSEITAKAALAAHKQGKYREMHVALMRSKAIAGPVVGGKEDTGPTRVEVERIAKSVGLDMNRFQKDMQSDAITLQIQRVHEEAAGANIDSTPGFYINGKFLAGFSEKQLDDMIAEARAKAKAG